MLTINLCRDLLCVCVCVGYAPEQPGYHCRDPTGGRVYVSRHVKFMEEVFPFAEKMKIHSPVQPSTNSKRDMRLPVFRSSPSHLPPKYLSTLHRPQVQPNLACKPHTPPLPQNLK